MTHFICRVLRTHLVHRFLLSGICSVNIDILIFSFKCIFFFLLVSLPLRKIQTQPSSLTLLWALFLPMYKYFLHVIFCTQVNPLPYIILSYLKGSCWYTFSQISLAVLFYQFCLSDTVHNNYSNTLNL